MNDPQAALRRALEAALGRALGASLGPAPQVTEMTRLTAGAANETWLFTAEGDAGAQACVLRRSPFAADAAPEDSQNLGKAGEARVQAAARAAGVPAAEVLFVLEERDDLGEGYVMAALDGETLPRKILRDDAYAELRPQLPALCGAALAQLHQVAPAQVPDLQPSPAAQQVERYETLYRSFEQPIPVFEVAFRVLADRCPGNAPLGVVHGDFRIGNFMVGPEGLRAILDWELAHLGDPMEDLGWLCVPSWRFGVMDQPVGGFGQRQALWSAYKAAGGVLSEDRAAFWELFGALKWGIMCMMMTRAHLSGATVSVERAAIGRRVSETVLDVLNYLENKEPWP